MVKEKSRTNSTTTSGSNSSFGGQCRGFSQTGSKQQEEEEEGAMTSGGRFDFDDGGSYCGGWAEGKAHGYGVCTGPKGQGHYDGAWHYGFEVSGTYTWPSGNDFEGQWNLGKRHGLGIENKGRWVYKGDWTHGFKGRYGVRYSTTSGAKYEGTWSTGQQDGYGVETYADGGTYRGQWLHGMRHGYGVRQSVPYSLAVHYRPKGLDSSKSSIHTDHEEDPQIRTRDRKVDQGRGGFVLKAKSDQEGTGQRRKSLFERQGGASLRRAIAKTLKRDRSGQRSGSVESPIGGRRRTSGGREASGSVRSTDSEESVRSGTTDSNASFVSQDETADATVVETYAGEWKNDKRCGYGVSERSDGLKYEGEWFNNKKNGYGMTTLQDGKKEEGKYKDNELTSTGKKSKLFLVRSNKIRVRLDLAVTESVKASEIAIQKTGIAISRMASAKSRSELSEKAAEKARTDAGIARLSAKQFHDIPLVIEVASKHDHTSSHETGSDGLKTTDLLDGPGEGGGGRGGGGSSKDKRGSKSLLLNAFSAALKRRQSNEMSAGSSPRRSLVSSSSPEDLDDRRMSDELNRRNRSNARSNNDDERLNNNSDYNNRPEPEDDVVRKTHIVAQRLNRTSVDLTGSSSSPKRHLNSVSWVTPESSSESDSRPPSLRLPTTCPPPSTAFQATSEAVSPQTSPDATSSNFESGSAGDSRASSFSDVSAAGRGARDLSLSTIDEEATGSQWRIGPSRDPPRRAGAGGGGGSGVVLRSKPVGPPSSSSSSSRVDGGGPPQEVKKSRRLTLPSLITVTQPLITINSPDASPLNASERHRGLSQSPLRPSVDSHPADRRSPTTRDTYAIINGVRTLVRPETQPSPATATVGSPSPGRSPRGGPESVGGEDPDETPSLPSRYILEPVMGRTGDLLSQRNRGSLPELFDLPVFGRGMSREEAHLLSERRREQLRREREEREKRYHLDIVLSLGDIKDWWRKRQLMMVVIALNLSLAAVFFNLLSR